MTGSDFVADLLEKYCPAWSEDSIRLYNTPSETARNIYFFIQECGYFKTNPHYYTERKNLDSYLVIFTLSGMGSLRYGGKKYTLPPNSLCLIDFRKHHKYRCDRGSCWEFLWFHFGGANGQGYYKEFAKNGFEIVKGDGQILSKIKNIISLTQNKQTDSEVLTNALITDILAHMISTASRKGKKEAYIPRYISYAKEYIDNNYPSAISIGKLAENVGYSNEHFAREFKKHIGVSAREYITTCRINGAKELLRQTDMTIEEIASGVGFGSSGRFIQVFRGKELTTPLQYRHRWRKI